MLAQKLADQAKKEQEAKIRAQEEAAERMRLAEEEQIR